MAASLLAVLFGTCVCRGFFYCNLPLESHGGVLLWLALLLYALRTLHMLCDCYLVPAIEAIVDRLQIPNNVASWTFIALGSSAPRFCTVFAATLMLENASGLGAVVGTSLYTVLAIVGLTGVTACKDHLNVHVYHPLLRDAAFLMLSVVELLFILLDDCVQWYEALLLLFTFGAYGAAARHGGRLGLTKTAMNFAGSQGSGEPPAVEAAAEVEAGAQDPPAADAGEGKEALADGPADASLFTPSEERSVASQDALDAPCPLVTALPDPLSFCLERTMPSPGGRCGLLLGLSLLLILTTTYVAVDSASRAATILNVPHIVMGLTVLAVGIAHSDAVGSVEVAKQGEGDLAISNSLGPLVFDSLVGLGLPWLLRCMSHGRVSFQQEFVAFRWDLVILLASIGFLLLVTLVNRQRLSRWAAAFLVLLYAVYCLYTFIGLFTTRSDAA